jgi:C4-dicarboxylate-specific signal transduction histidine kinase
MDEVIRSELAAFRDQYASVTWEGYLHCPGVRVIMHEQWLSRLLHHLMRNALDAMPEDRDKPTVWLRTAREDGMAAIEIEDNEGACPEIAGLLFHQAIPPTDRPAGRGLLLAHFLAEQHGGQLQLLWNRPGEGACFRLTIPTAGPG